ncbi:MAG: BtpA/SgcQ family protein [Chloroflexota bacterium]
MQRTFSQRHIILPVIHVESETQALRNVQIARNANVDGVFLINHAISSSELLTIHHTVVSEHNDWWVGVNCLDLSPIEIFQSIDNTVRGVWVDNAMIDEDFDSQPEAERILDARRKAGWTGLYFGGVAFKYQRPVADLAQAAAIAAKYVDVVTTSGPGTGHAALPEKISTMKQSLGTHPLAIASGITPENVGDYLDSADCFLVATGISKSFEELDPKRVQALVHRIRTYSSRS